MKSKIDTFMTKFRERYNSQYDRILIAINENVEDASNMFIKLFYSAADCMRVGRAGSRTNRNIFASKPWWDTVCESFKTRKMQALRLFKTMGNMINLADYLSLRNNYKNLCRNKKHEYKNKPRQKLVDSRKNPSTFWKLLKNNVTSIKSNIHPHTWYNYSKFYFHWISRVRLVTLILTTPQPNQRHA